MSFINFGPRTMRAGGFAFIKTTKLSQRVINKTGSIIAADKLVALLGFDTTSGLPKVVLADANVAAHDNIYVTPDAIAIDAEAYVYKGAMSTPNLNTNFGTVGDPIYLSETAGAFTGTAPTATDSVVYPVGFMAVKSATVGQIFWNIGPIRKISSNGATVTMSAANLDGVTLDANGAGSTVEVIPAALKGTQVALVANVNVIGGIPVVHRVTASALTGDVTVVLTHKTRITDVVCINTTGAGGAGDTIIVKNVATAITDTMDINKADKTITRAATIDDAQWDVAAGANLVVSGASAVNCEVLIYGIRVA
jgi:hypothetical protein